MFESGVPPELHAWAFEGGRPVPPAEVDLTVDLTRLGGAREQVRFVPVGDYLRGSPTVHEPHSFDVRVAARHSGRAYEWSYESYEGRTTIAAEIASAAGIATAIAGPGTIADTFVLYGTIAHGPHARARGASTLPGRDPDRREEGRRRCARRRRARDDRVEREPADLRGHGTDRRRRSRRGTPSPASRPAPAPLFEIVDLSTVWAELNVFSRDRPRLRAGTTVQIAADNGAQAEGTIDYLAPVGNRSSQSVAARVVLDNAEGLWTPGQFVEARVTVSETPVALAVPLGALQRFREFDVVFAKVGDVYEVRMLTLGPARRRQRRDPRRPPDRAPNTSRTTATS